MSAPFVGKGIDRVDGRSKVTGCAPYAAEVAVANVAHAVMVASRIARGTISSIDTSAAERAPGVLIVLTHLNAPKIPGLASASKDPTERQLQLLQDNVVQYSDQPIAVVVADTLERAQHAAELVSVRYETASVVAALDADSAGAYAPAKAGRAATDSKRGDVEHGLASGVVRVDATYSTPIQNHNPMEPHATIAVWQGDDRLTLYDSTQGVFGVRKVLAKLFALPDDRVRVVNQFVGGGFGTKGGVWSHVALAAMAAKVTGRPVKLAITRPQMFSSVGHRPKTIQKLSLAADASGVLTAIRHDVVSETSRFDEYVEASAVQTRMLYGCDNVSTSHRLVRLDIGTPTYQRGPGESTGTYALESAMGELAYALKMDPLTLRLRNYAEADLDASKPYSSKSLRECYRVGAEKFGWSRRSAEPRSMREGRQLIGWGMATATYPANQSASSAVARIRADGTLLVQAGTQDIGTGTYTIMTQIAADALSMEIDRVRFELGDTTFPETPGSGGSTTASSTGSAVKMATLALRDRLIATAVADLKSPLYGLRAEEIFSSDGALAAKSDASKRDPYGSIVARTGQSELAAELKTEARSDRKKFSTHGFGADFVEVRVDESLGEIRVTRVVGAFGVGKILNAKTARSQLLGGLVWAIGFALTERTERDMHSARVVTRDLADYYVPVHADVPQIDVMTVDEDDPVVNELGAKGIGEIGITGAAAAIANAVFHATGRRVRDLPITVEKLL